MEEMDDSEPISSLINRTQLIDKPKSTLKCHVCEIEGAQYHYGGLCCVSCKMFFRRNANFDLVSDIMIIIILKFIYMIVLERSPMRISRKM